MANQFLFGFLYFAFFYDNVIAIRYTYIFNENIHDFYL